MYISPQSSHRLLPLVGKTLLSIDMVEIDLDGDSNNVRQQYTFTTTDGTVVAVSLDGGCDGQYARLEGAIDISEEEE